MLSHVRDLARLHYDLVGSRYTYRAHEFSCINAPLTAPHAEFFRCSTQWGTSTSRVLMVTDMVKNTVRQQTVGQQSTQHLFAVAIVYETKVRALDELVFAFLASP